MARLRTNSGKPDCLIIEGVGATEWELLKKVWDAMQFGPDSLYLNGGNMNPCGSITIGIRDHVERAPSKNYVVEHLQAILHWAGKLQAQVISHVNSDLATTDDLIKHPSTAIMAHAGELHKAFTGVRDPEELEDKAEND